MVQFHTGSLAGLVAICGMIPDDHIAVYIFGNLDHSEIRHALMYKAFDMWAFTDSHTDWSTDFYKLYKNIADTAKKRETEQLAKQVKGTQSSLPLKEYAGKYSNKIYGDVKVFATNDSLTLEFLTGKLTLSLRHWNYDTFQGRYNYWWWGKSFVQFSVDATGKVSQLSIDGTFYEKEIQK
jgi:hypothetical protein